MAVPTIPSLLQHPAFPKFIEYLNKLRAFYDGMLVFNSKDSYTDAILKGKIQAISEIIVLPEAIKLALTSKGVQ